MSKRTAALMSLLCAGMLLMSACVKLDMQAKIDPDEKVSGTIIVAFSNTVNPLSGDPSVDLPELPDGAHAELYSADGVSGYTVTFEDIGFDEFNSLLTAGADEPALALESSEHTITLMSVEPDLAPDLPDVDEDARIQFEQFIDQMAQSAEINLTMTFPGEVLETNGELDGQTVSWTIDAISPEPVFAMAEREPSSDSQAPADDESTNDNADTANDAVSDGASILPVVLGVGLLVFAVALIIGLVVMRRRNNSTTADTDEIQD